MTTESRDALRACAALPCIRVFWGAQRNCPDYTDGRELCATCLARAALDVPGASDPRETQPVMPDAEDVGPVDYIRRRVAEDLGPNGRSWPGEIDNILDDAEALFGIGGSGAGAVQQGEPSLDVDELTDIGNVLLAAGKGPAHDHEMCAGCDSDEEIIGEAASRIGRLLARLRSQPSKERQP